MDMRSRDQMITSDWSVRPHHRRHEAQEEAAAGVLPGRHHPHVRPVGSLKTVFSCVYLRRYSFVIMMQDVLDKKLIYQEN